MDFTSQDLTLSIDDFAERVLEPAMSQLATSVESDVLSGVANQVYQQYGSADSLATFTADPMKYFLQAKAILNKSLTPKDNKRYALLNSITMAGLVYGNKALFQDASAISEGYLEGIVGRMSGLTFIENELVNSHTLGVYSGTQWEIDASNIYGSTLTVTAEGGSATTMTEGTLFTIDGVYQVHPETKASYSNLQQFVILGTGSGHTAPTTTSWVISPPIIPVGGVAGVYVPGMANVSNVPTNDVNINIIGTTALSYVNNLVYHKDFATFVTADLYMPKGGMEMAAREVYDGVSMRLLKGFDIINDIQISRFDVLYGYQIIRPQLASRVYIAN